MNKKYEVVGILCSDLHLSHNPPVFRSVEKDWYGVMEGYLKQLQSLQVTHNCPIIIAGDIFDRWNAPSELVNFALENIPSRGSYAIPGQHDLAYHQYKDIEKTSFYTLISAGVINLLDHKYPVSYSYYGRAKQKGTFVNLFGFPWNEKITPCKNPPGLNVCVMHKYVWCDENKHPLAKKEDHIESLFEVTENYNVVVCGDNHKGFLHKGDNYQFFVPGGFMVRKSDDLFKPCVGLLYSNGKIKRHYLDTSKDKYLIMDREERKLLSGGKMAEFVAELESLGDAAIDFQEAVSHHLKSTKEIPEGVKTLIRKALEP